MLRFLPCVTSALNMVCLHSTNHVWGAIFVFILGKNFQTKPQ